MAIVRVGILGAGRQALETSQYLFDAGVETAFFYEEVAPGFERDPVHYGAPVLGPGDVDDDLASLPVVTAVGDPDVRRRLVDGWPGTAFWTAVSPHAWLARDAVLGEGCTIGPFASVNRCATVGAHVLVNVGASIAHDVVIGAWSTLGPRSAIAGGTTLGEGVTVGIGATLIDHVHVGDGAVIGAGAVVVGDVPAGVTVVGVPARPVERRP